MTELYKRFRPKSLKTVQGQAGAIASLQRLIDAGKIPHALLLTGPSGVGKTTIARILKGVLGCGDSDYYEINAADEKGIEMVRSIRKHVNLSPMDGACRIWVIDESHKLTGDAQNAILKILEDTPKHAYFFLATTDPHKLIKTIHTRCTEVKLVSLPTKALEATLQRVIEKEGFKVQQEVIDEIVEAAEGSARKALVILEQVALLDTHDEQLAAVVASSAAKDQAILIARALFAPSPNWSEIAKVLRECKDDPESIRYLILGYSRTILLGGGKLAPQAFKVIDIFGRNFYDSKHAGLAAACWEAIRN